MRQSCWSCFKSYPESVLGGNAQTDRQTSACSAELASAAARVSSPLMLLVLLVVRKRDSGVKGLLAARAAADGERLDRRRRG